MKQKQCSSTYCLRLKLPTHTNSTYTAEKGGNAHTPKSMTYLWARTANFADVTVVYLWRFWGLFRLEHFVLEGGFLGECAASPGCRGCGSCNSLLLLLLLLLLLVVRGCSRVYSCLIA